MKRLKIFAAVILVTISAFCLFSFVSSAADEGKWITTWSTAPTKIGIDGYDNISVYVGDVTARTVITPTASGTQLRVKFSNYYGTEPLVISKATVALSTGDSGIDTSTLMYLHFDGKPGVSIPAGQEVYSDAVPFNTVAGDNIAVSTYLKEFSEIKTMGLSGGETYLTMGSGYDMSDAVDFNPLNGLEIEDQWVYDMLDGLLGSILNQGTLEVPVSYSFIKVVPALASVEVLNPNDDAYSVVVIGDSTVSNEFPLYLAQAINREGITDIGVAGKGIIGNRLLGDGLGYGSNIFGEALITRMSRDIIGLDGENKSNVKYVIIKIGANDIMHPVCSDIQEMYPGITQPTAAEIIEGYKQVFEFCHSHGIKVIAVGITQWKGNDRDYLGTGAKYVRTEEEFAADWQIALDVNEWLASTSLHDGYVYYNDISKNPEDPEAFLPEYTIDGAHPSDTLQKLWGDSFPLSLIGVTNRTAGVGLSETSLTIYKGETKKLTATVTPSDAVNKSVTWSSSNPSAVTVDSNGNITAVGKGEAVIRVKTVDKGYSGTGYEAVCRVTVKVKPEKMVINGSASTIYTTRTLQLSAVFSPSDCDFKDVTWSSSNTKVATVDSKGLVTAVGKGTVVITAASTDDSAFKATYTLNVKKKVSVESVNLNHTEKTVNLGKTLKLEATINPAKASFPELKWSSSDTSVATVDKNGKVTTKKAGVAVITCKSVDNPMCKASCVVTVRIKVTGLNISKTKLNMYVSQSKTLVATVTPANATNRKVTFSSSDKSVASVSKNGRITAKKEGSCIITVKTKGGKFVKSCVVKVKKYVAMKDFSLSKTSVTINDGKTFKLKANFSPSNASNRELIWGSTNKDVATVSSTGKIKGINPGTCTITCTSKATGKTVSCTVKVKRVRVKAVYFDEKVYTVDHNKKLKLGVLISPSNATNQKIRWKSSHPDFVKVSKKGVVTGVALGKNATITATTADGKKVATCVVKVAEVPVEGMKLNKTTANLGLGGTVTLAPKFTPKKPSNQKVIWTSSDTKVAKVSESGVVTPVKDGTAVITCVSDDGGYKATCTVVVKSVKVEKITLDKSSINADAGAVFSLNATVSPENASNKRVVWSSTNTSVATVTSSGQITAVSAGVAYIKVKSEDGNYTAYCKITVS